ncbi:MAG: radical SAM family heme chaperone HemW [Candidatus Eisenbacteria bacterium]|uniref:Heme chaperone HemW n=1 Tax=Eiseniibacteriota bacterium TaxID=2212470 RepID=A0A956NAD5_UNCEI|nr:radical SAM family heme chaperone HemW [Candidatus Eisenbacteria bacterium]MCB9462692.1 radical SAM family heme chaperone HemW [Candidatus Eisenbacteria bacterium]
MRSAPGNGTTGPGAGPSGETPSERERGRYGPGIYVHFPFCVQRCGYCDFFVVLGGDDAREAYVEQLLREIDLAARSQDPRFDFSDATFQTLFFGGGTPSLLTPLQMETILTRLRSRFRFAEDAEITVECNPESATADRLRAYRELGVNRVSFGVQSLDREELRLLDRAHGAGDAARRMDDARRAGFSAVSLDLIYGLPGTAASTSGTPTEAEMRWLRTLESALALQPDHLSAYLLGLEPHVPLARKLKRGQVAELPGDEDSAAQYDTLRARTSANGLVQYEISNFARPGEESRHNQNYWLCGDYLGLGPSAHSHRRGVRWSNVKSLPGYRDALAKSVRPFDTEEVLDPQQRAEEWIFLGLRRTEGVPLPLITEWWGEGAVERLQAVPALEKWLEFDQPLAPGESRVRLAPEALFVSNTVFAECCEALGPVRGRGLVK